MLTRLGAHIRAYVSPSFVFFMIDVVLCELCELNFDRRDQVRLPPRSNVRVKAERRFSGLTKRLAARDAVPPHARHADHGPAEAGHYRN
jgi:hypothetical protein